MQASAFSSPLSSASLIASIVSCLLQLQLRFGSCPNTSNHVSSFPSYPREHRGVAAHPGGQAVALKLESLLGHTPVA